MQQMVCPKCKATMEEGFVVDFGYGATTQSKWMPGMTEASFWTGNKVDKSKLVPIKSFKCVGCGYLESYAGA